MAPRRKITFRGRTYPVIDELTVGDRLYLVLAKLGRGDRGRYQVFDKFAGPKGDLRLIHVLPRSRATEQHLGVLQQLSRNNSSMPSILEYHSQGRDIFVFTPWLWGTDLKTFLARGRKNPRQWPSAVQAFNLYRRLAHSLSQLHRLRNVIHADLKPANLVLCREPNRLVMIDFGSAWTVEKTIGRDIGDGQTDEYASPEQHLEQKFVDFRSDQFSASVIAYEMLTGDLPYDKIGGQVGLPDNRSAFEDKLVPPSQCCRDCRPLPPRVWSKIDRVVLKGLSVSPEMRFKTDELWLDELDDIDTDLNRRPPQSVFSRALQSAIKFLPESFRPKT